MTPLKLWTYCLKLHLNLILLTQWLFHDQPTSFTRVLCILCAPVVMVGLSMQFIQNTIAKAFFICTLKKFASLHLVLHKTASIVTQNRVFLSSTSSLYTVYCTWCFLFITTSVLSLAPWREASWLSGKTVDTKLVLNLSYHLISINLGDLLNFSIFVS